MSCRRRSLVVVLAAAAALCGVVTSLNDATTDADDDLERFHVVYEWYKLDYAWPDDAAKARALASRRYLPENNALSGVATHADRVYLTVPRYRDGVPATLVSIPVRSPDRNASPKLEPFPSWEMQQVDNCTALQSVQNVEIDNAGRMWVLDNGRVDTMTKKKVADVAAETTPTTTRCPAKLLLIDLADAKILKTFDFPESLVDPASGYLVDLVLDPVDGWYVYVSDADDRDPGILVYSLREDRAWKVRDAKTMRGDVAARKFSVAGRPTEVLQNVSPLAVDLTRSLLYYSPLSSRRMYAVSTASLRAGETSLETSDLGRKAGLSAGFAMDERGVMYYGVIDDNGVAKWDTNATSSFEEGQRVIARDPVRLQWPTCFGFDETGYLWLVSNRFHNYVAGRVDLSEANYRVVRGYTGSRSYLHAEGAANVTSRHGGGGGGVSGGGGAATTTTSLTLIVAMGLVARRGDV